MKQCRHIKRLLSSYVDGRMSGAARQAMARHLELCRQCADEHRALCGIKEALHRLAEVEPSPGFEPAFARALDRNWREVIRAPGVAQRWTWFWNFEPLAPLFWRVAVPVLAVLLLMVNAAQRGPEIQLTGLRGGVLLEKVSELDWRQGGNGRLLAKADRLRPGQALRTDFGGEAQVLIDGKIQLKVGEKSRVYLARAQGKDYRIDLAEGTVHAQTTDRFAGSRFTVTTPFSRTVVTGTSFLVSCWPGGSETRVLQGRVKLESTAGGAPVWVAANEKAEVLDGRAPGRPAPMIEAELRNAAWFVNPDSQRSSRSRIPVDSRRESDSRRSPLLPGFF